MKVSFDGVNAKMVTFEAAQGVKEGALVKVSAAGKAAPCTAAGDVPIGVAVSVRDGICGVQTQGYMKVPCAAGTAVGFGLFACDGDGSLASGTSGRPGFVLDVYEQAGLCGVML